MNQCQESLVTFYQIKEAQYLSINRQSISDLERSQDLAHRWRLQRTYGKLAMGLDG